MTPLEIVEYYANLLIMQYKGLPNAYGTIVSTITPLILPQQSEQTITFSSVPTSGYWGLSFNGFETANINWNDTASTIQTYLQALPTLGSVTCTGTYSTGFVVEFVNVPPIAPLLIAVNRTLQTSGVDVDVTVTETDVTIPIALQNAFNIETAEGVQLDTLGQFAGVTRTTSTPTQTITLDDNDFRTLIKFAIVQNNSGSSLFTIETNLNNFFPGQFILVDNANMTLTYIFSSSLGSTQLFDVLIQEKLIPKPMGVQVYIIITPVAQNFFGYRTYESENPSVKPFNTYEDFNENWFFLTYEDVIAI